MSDYQIIFSYFLVTRLTKTTKEEKEKRNDNYSLTKKVQLHRSGEYQRDLLGDV
jgi:hypothetical protein